MTRQSSLINLQFSKKKKPTNGLGPQDNALVVQKRFSKSVF